MQRLYNESYYVLTYFAGALKENYTIVVHYDLSTIIDYKNETF